MRTPISQQDREEDAPRVCVKLVNNLPMGRTYGVAAVFLVMMVVFALAGLVLRWFRIGGFQLVLLALVFWPLAASLFVAYRYRHPATVFLHPTHFVVKYHIGKESRIVPENVREVMRAAWSFPDCYVIMYVTPMGRLWGFTLTSEVTHQLFKRYPKILLKVKDS